MRVSFRSFSDLLVANCHNRQEEESVVQRELGVVFQDLRVQGRGADASYLDTVGSLFNPLNIPARIREARHPSVRDILYGFEGVVKPGEMLRVSLSFLVGFKYLALFSSRPRPPRCRLFHSSQDSR